MFYTYNQSNPGGRFIQNDKLGQYVVIEADSADDANSRAENVGIYFDGCDDGMDCSCCGDRWYRAELSRSEGDAEPMIYGQTIEEFVAQQDFTPLEKHMFVHIHYKDGRHEKMDIDIDKAVKENQAKKRAQAEKLWAVRFNGYGITNKPIRVYEHKNLKHFYDKGGNFGIDGEGLLVEPTYGTVSYASKNKADVEAFITGVILALHTAKQAAYSAILSHNCDKGPVKSGMEVVVNHLARMLHDDDDE